MRRRLARACLLLLMAGSGLLTLQAAADIARSPGLAPLVARSSEEIVAATDRMMAATATPGHLSRLIAARLNEDPRNWIALAALRDEAAARGIALPVPLAAAYDAAFDDDTGPAAQAADCAACLWDIAACSLSNVLICKAPILLTPVEDIRGIAKAGWDNAQGNPVDGIDLGLSIAGLGATSLILASGGTNATVKLGAGLARIARGMDLLSPRLAATMGDALRAGVDWAALPAVRSAGDLAGLVRADALAPVTAVMGDLGRIRRAVGTTGALHLLAHVDDAADARRMARATEALGTRSVGRIEVLGKARFLRATVRWSDAAREVMAGLLGMLAAGAALLTGVAHGLGLRLIGRVLR